MLARITFSRRGFPPLQLPIMQNTQAAISAHTAKTLGAFATKNPDGREISKSNSRIQV
jgi:hypothetical protein